MAEVRKNFLYNEVLPRTERLHWLVAATGLGFRYSLLRSGSILLMVGLSGLSVIYFLRAFEPVIEDVGPEFSTAYSPVTESPELLRQFQYIASALTLLGILFKLLLWQGQAELLLVSVSTLLITISLKWATSQQACSILLIGSLGLLIWLVPTETLVRTFYRDDPALVEKMLFQHQHPGDKAATAEVLRLLNARRNR
ncbi:hypothetical protein [Hymenobacter cheonanensis]|uniref:hypothetical protein n=1 Tax=Hymenobacter sp. CA2-7 TaxID=3063993 RepID=UPI002712389C|nr:hypothetical protein [Hymenobacter sp. CA2-7]MDO7883925.1 hypothetical protein [Hymenobacter sp. CA2-7]